ncbi:MAG: hypothetical protein U0002_19960 [Thermoanaerobaculia bacterium]
MKKLFLLMMLVLFTGSVAADPGLPGSSVILQNSADGSAAGWLEIQVGEAPIPAATTGACWQLFVVNRPSGSGYTTRSPSANCTTIPGKYENGTIVYITAIPFAGHTFAGFSPNCAPLPGDQCGIILLQNETVSAYFN